MSETISADFPFAPRRVSVLGSELAYVDEGEGDPILLLHGNPTWSYLWRNIIPHLRGHGRCIAPDLVGMGRSDKPDIPYRFADHARFLAGFIEALGLDGVVLVVHDWGSALGFDWAMRNESRVRGIAFMESIVTPVPTWADFPEVARELFASFRTAAGEDLVLERNVFIEQLLPGSVVRPLSTEELARYRAPFPDPRSRRPVLAWPRELPIAGEPADVVATVERYRDALRRSAVPKLMFTVEPGVLMPPPVAKWCRDNFPALEEVALGAGVHYVQEDHPHAIGRALADWIDRLPSTARSS